MPQVSIITATYNRSDVLRWAVAAVRAQSFSDWEHIIIGDACTDDTADVVASFGDERIVFCNRAQNFGEQSGPNNDAFAQARGDLIAYLNHDDLWFPDHLESLMKRMSETDADLVYALPVSIDRHGQAFCGPTKADLRYDPSHFVPASYWLARRSLILDLGGWRPAREIYAHNPSQDFLFRAWRKGRRIVCNPRLTALTLPSGGRPNAYVDGDARQDDARQHEILFHRLQNPTYREILATTLAMEASRRKRPRALKARAVRWLESGVARCGFNPSAVGNLFAGRRKGWWIDELRALRGLPKLGKRAGD